MLIQRLRYFRDWLRGLCFKPFFLCCGKGLRIDKSAFISGLNWIVLGNNIFINKGCVIQGGGLVFIGDNTLLAPYVQIYAQEHSKEDFNTPVYGRVSIGKNCWIGANTIILKGATIPENTIVPAGSIVTRKGIICRGILSREDWASSAITSLKNSLQKIKRSSPMTTS